MISNQTPHKYNFTCIHIHTHIFIYVYTCLSVCVSSNIIWYESLPKAIIASHIAIYWLIDSVGCVCVGWGWENFGAEVLGLERPRGLGWLRTGCGGGGAWRCEHPWSMFETKMNAAPPKSQCPHPPICLYDFGFVFYMNLWPRRESADLPPVNVTV